MIDVVCATSEVITTCQVALAYEPMDTIYYETNSVFDGCWYSKCANGYAYWLYNGSCRQGHARTSTWASGYPSCPHGYPAGDKSNYYAHCMGESGWGTPGYRAPCGRTTHKTSDDIYGYVTRTHIGCHSTTVGIVLQ